MDLPTRLEIVQLYYANNNSPSATLRAYKTKFQLRNDPFTQMAIIKLIQKFESTFSLHDAPRSGRPSVINDDNIEQVRSSLEEQSNNNSVGISSIHQASKDTGMCYSVTRTIIKDHLNYKHYKPKFVQQLYEDDAIHRLEFANVFEQQLMSHIDNILWTDEAHFHLYGEVSSLNGYIWAPENPHAVVQKPLHSPKLTVFIGFNSQFITTPYFYAEGECVKKENYIHAIKSHVIPFLKSKRAYSRTIFMQDGATPHTARMSLDFRRANFGDRIISRSCDWFWPPRSPDITPCDFWLWGYLKRKVYTKKINNLSELKNAIIHEVNNIPTEMLRDVVYSVPDRLAKLKNENGQHIMH